MRNVTTQRIGHLAVTEAPKRPQVPAHRGSRTSEHMRNSGHSRLVGKHSAGCRFKSYMAYFVMTLLLAVKPVGAS
jgi:hypothetical protein